MRGRYIPLAAEKHNPINALIVWQLDVNLLAPKKKP